MKVISKKEAKHIGLKRYFTGKPCIKNHVSERKVSNGGCIQCVREKSVTEEYRKTARKYVDKNSEKIKEADRNRYSKNKSEINEKRRVKYSSNSDYSDNIKKNNVAYRNKNKDAINNRRKEKYWSGDGELRAKCADLHEKNKDNIHKRQREYYKKNKEMFMEKRKRWGNENKENIFIRNSLKRITKGIVGSISVACKHLGYGAEELRLRMECQFKDGMSWSNYGEWHIDHKKPIVRFINQGITDQRIINALSNLQPLWAKDNLSKNSKF